MPFSRFIRKKVEFNTASRHHYPPHISALLVLDVHARRSNASSRPKVDRSWSNTWTIILTNTKKMT